MDSSDAFFSIELDGEFGCVFSTTLPSVFPDALVKKKLKKLIFSQSNNDDRIGKKKKSIFWISRVYSKKKKATPVADKQTH